MNIIKRKLVFNATILNDRLTGLGVYCKNIVNRLENNFNVVLYTDNYKKAFEENSKEVVLRVKSNNKIKNIILRNRAFKKWIKDNKGSNILHYSPTQHGVRMKGIKQIITIHDLMPLYFPKGRLHQYFYYKVLLKRIINNSNLIITVSENTKKDILKEYKVNEDKVKVIYNGFDEIKESIDKEYSKNYIKDKFNIENYILMVGIHYKYKNLHSVIEAYDRNKEVLKVPLVIVGGTEGSYGKELIKLVNKKNLNDKVKFLGFVTNEDKNLLYQAAKLFIYPSLYEGFGLPVLEAMSNGTVVACSNSSSLPEVVGDAAYMFDPNNLYEIESALLTMTNISNEEYIEYMLKSRRQLEKFSWDKCANEILEAINGVRNE